MKLHEVEKVFWGRRGNFIFLLYFVRIKYIIVYIIKEYVHFMYVSISQWALHQNPIWEMHYVEVHRSYRQNSK
jgi:hypothetical protein